VTLDDGAEIGATRELLEEIAELHQMVSARFDGNNARRPSRHSALPIPRVQPRFAGPPMNEFTFAIRSSSRRPPPKVDAELIEQSPRTDRFHFDVFLARCQPLPRSRCKALTLALENPERFTILT
jgi:alkyl hydroperoxide reductase subunit F